MVAVVDPSNAAEALAAMKGPGKSSDTAIIGSLQGGRAVAVLEMEIGGERILEELEDDPLPRIC